MERQRISMESDDDPFFGLLQSTSPPPSVLPSNSSHGLNSPKKEDNPFSDFMFGQDDVLPGYDFHPVQSIGIGGTSSVTTGSISTTRHEESSLNGNKGRQSSPPQPSYASANPSVYRSRELPIIYESSIQRQDHVTDSIESATVAAVERTMKKYVDHLLRVLEGISGRLLHLENTTQRLERSVEVLKADAANNHGESDGKLRMLENFIKEVQSGVQILRDKQEISEAQSKLVKLQLVKSEAPTSATSPMAPVEVPTQLSNISHGQQAEPVVQQSSVGPQQLSMALQQRPLAPQTHTALQQPSAAPQPPVNFQQQPQPQQFPALPAPPGAQSQSSQALQQQTHPPVFPNGSSFSSVIPAPSPQSHAPPPYSQQQPTQSQQMQSFYNQPPHLQQQYAHYQPEAPPFGTVAQGPQPQGLLPLPQGSQPQRPHQLPSPAVYHLSETSYTPTALQPGPPPQPQSFQIPPQQHGGSVQQMYDQSYGRSNSRPLPQPAPYSPQAQPLQGNPVYGPHAVAPSTAYNNPNYPVVQPLSAAPGGGGYSRFPVAQPIQQSSTHAGVPSGQPLPQNRVPVDDVVEKVASMGFSREQVQTVVRRLTESGQSADLNVVLDKLMNGGEAQSQRVWFGR